MPTLIVNEKGLFVPVEFEAVCSRATVAKMRALGLPTIPAGKSAELARLALDALDELPERLVRIWTQRWDKKHDKARQKLWDEASDEDLRSGALWDVEGDIEALGWFRPRPARATAPSDERSRSDIAEERRRFGPSPHFEGASAEEAGWTALPSIVKGKEQLRAMWRAAGCQGPIRAVGQVYEIGWLEAMRPSLSKKSELWSFDRRREDSQPGEARCWVVCVADGCLDPSGALGPLGRARLYESAAAAQRAGSKLGSGFQVVQVSLSIEAVDRGLGSGPVAGKLAAALCSREAAQIESALERASVDQLRARLAEAEAAQGRAPQKELGAQAKPRL